MPFPFNRLQLQRLRRRQQIRSAPTETAHEATVPGAIVANAVKRAKTIASAVKRGRTAKSARRATTTLSVHKLVNSNANKRGKTLAKTFAKTLVSSAGPSATNLQHGGLQPATAAVSSVRLRSVKQTAVPQRAQIAR
ncbi:hypothetical protein GCM10023115_21510 [Pontixanthobacter gangjinensis]